MSTSDLMQQLKLDTLKAKMSSKPSADNKETFHIAKSTTFAGVQTALNAFKEVAGKTGVPGLQEGIKALVIVLDAVQKTSQNAEDIGTLGKRIEALTETLEKATADGVSPSQAMRNRIDRLSESWKRSAKAIQEIGSQKYMKRFINRDDDARTIAGQISSITWSIDTFTVESMLAIEFALDDTYTLILQSANRTQNMLVSVQRDILEIKMRQDVYGGLVLPHAITARYDCNDKLKPCHEGTRTDILSLIDHWVELGDVSSGPGGPEGDKLHTARVLWINGPGSAGTGKSTIAYTVARKLDKQEKLGASFFCSRDNSDSSNPKLIFPTIVYQLGQFYLPLRREISAVLKADPEVAHLVPERQLERLLVKPLYAVKEHMPFCVVVIDALDECQDGGATSTILSSLAQYITMLSPIKFLVTSRPEASIVSGFKLARLSQTTQRYILHHVEPKVVDKDLLLYLHSCLQKTKAIYGLDASWPSIKDVQRLVHLSSGLFIYAATAAKFIQDRHYSNPQGQLAQLLSTMTTTDSTPHGLLDQLYLQVLECAFPTMSPEFAGRLKLVLGSLVLLYNPMSPANLEQLLVLPVPLQGTLEQLQSVVVFPQNSNELIHLIHPSFHEFLTNSNRCTNPKFLVSPQLQHSFLAQACLDAMKLKLLKKDICKVKQPWKLPNPNSVQQHIPQFLQYACHHWSQHFLCGLLSEKLLTTLEKFCTKHLLYWVEVCSLTGNLWNAFMAMKSVHQLLSASAPSTDKISGLLYDCQQLIREFFSLLRVAPSQLYISVPAFLPKNTALLEIYGQEFQNSLKVLYHGNRPQYWDACVWTLEGHTAPVNAAVFSPDGNYVVSVSSDQTIQFWDSVNGIHVETLPGHNSELTSLVFSHDGAYFLTGSHDCTVRLWDAHSKEILFMIDTKSEVTSVAFSPKGNNIVFGTCDWNVNLWKPWEPLVIPSKYSFDRLEGHSGIVLAVTFSPDGVHFLSGSLDTTILLWKVDSDKVIHKFRGHTGAISTVAFSHDGTQIVSGSWDNTVYLWNAKTGSQQRQLKGHQDRLNSISFSPDDKYIVSASSDKTIQIWGTNSGTHLKTFMGHSQSVTSVSFSPDGTQIVSASADQTVKVWDCFGQSHKKVPKNGNVHAISVSNNGMYIASVMSTHTIDLWNSLTGAPIRTLMGHSDPILCVSFSPNNQLILSGSSDVSIRVWDIVSGSCLQIMKGHVGAVQSVKFLSNSINIISGSSDKSVQYWNAKTGEHLKTFIAHSDIVHCVSLSSDDTYVASGSQDKTVQVWNLKLDKHVLTLNAHSSSVYQVAFSPTNTILASGSFDQTIHLSDIISGAIIRTINLNIAVKNHINFTPDQQFIVTGPICLETELPLLNSKNLDPFDYQLFALYYLKDGWIVDLSSQHKICWIPQAYQGMLVSTANGAALSTSIGTIIILDFTNIQVPTNNVE